MWYQLPALAQTSAVTSSVLPTGGGQALINTSDTVFLLLDHQTGLFQTVKDISVAELRANTVDARQAGNAFENSRHHHRIGA